MVSEPGDRLEFSHDGRQTRSGYAGDYGERGKWPVSASNPVGQTVEPKTLFFHVEVGQPRYQSVKTTLDPSIAEMRKSDDARGEVVEFQEASAGA